LSTRILDRLQRLLSKTKKGEETPVKEIMSSFELHERPLVEIALADLVDKGLLELVSSKPGSCDLYSSKIKLKGESLSLQKELDKIAPSPAMWQVVLTVPEPLRDLIGNYLGTNACLKHLLASAKQEILALVPYIDSSFVEAMSDEFRAMTKSGIRLTLVTREVGKTPGSLRATLRLHEIFRANVIKRDLLKVYQYWVPIKYFPERDFHYTALHAKVVIQDLDNAYLGSANWTEESMARNLEVGLLLSDKSIIDSLRRVVSSVLTESSRVDVSMLYDETMKP